MHVEFIDKLGSDLTVVNAARVSFDKHANEMKPTDSKLLAYLASHDHWSPFGHAQAQFRVTAPLFVARQLVKHQVGLVWNEVSRRYVDSKPEFCEMTWRYRAENKKQGSAGAFDAYNQEYFDSIIYNIHKRAKEAYEELIEFGVAPEQARVVLPQTMMTSWYWTGSLYAFARVVRLRTGDDAQLETREVAEAISGHLKREFPLSWKVLSDPHMPA